MDLLISIYIHQLNFSIHYNTVVLSLNQIISCKQLLVHSVYTCHYS
uniref:Uncharacterized protein n=1 Tax=viral metagenome TaxID=1070528 RepID=A0A6C0BMV9_9ZZZZ